MAVRSTEWNRAVQAFEHLHTEHAPARADKPYRHGHVLWGAISGADPIAVCWEWAEVRRGVVAICNPMNVLSNARLLSDDGQALTLGQHLLALNTVVHELDWQTGVCEELSLRGAKSVIPLAPRARRPAVSHRRAPAMLGAQPLAA